MMYCAINGRCVAVREANGQLVRKFNMNMPVIGAQVSGDNVVIQCEGGWTYIYQTNGMLVRKTRN